LGFKSDAAKEISKVARRTRGARAEREAAASIVQFAAQICRGGRGESVPPTTSDDDDKRRRRQATTTTSADDDEHRRRRTATRSVR